MAQNNLFSPDTASFGKLLGNGLIYKIPPYQRDYAWKKEDWEDLWSDIVEIYQTGQKHYMGAIVIQDVGGKTYQVIDGQQRLVTFSLIVLAVIKNLQDLIDAGIETTDNEERISILIKNYIGSKSAGSLRYSSKVFLNENNDAFYQTYLVQLKPPNNPTRLNDSEKQLWGAFQFFYQNIKAFFTANGAYNGRTLSDFLDLCVAEKLFFIAITVGDELNAYTVFETLNDRGTRLTVTDLLKNYLFSIAGNVESDLQLIKNQWNNIVGIIDLEPFPVFLRHFWNSRNGLIRQDRLFKTIRNSYKQPDQVFQLLDQLEKSANVYAALSNPYDELWGGNRQIQQRIREFGLFRVTQCFPLLLVAYERFDTPNFEKALKICSVISFRYNVIGERNPNVMEDIYNQAAQKVFHGAISTAAQLFTALKPIYVSDEDFKHDFATKQLKTRRNKSLVRYILFHLENQSANTDYDYEINPGTIEHVLPENPGAEWDGFFGQDIQENYIYRLGNYTLLEVEKNRMCQNKMYEAKRPIYETSQYKITQQLQYPEWTPRQLNARQNRLATIATGIWKVSE